MTYKNKCYATCAGSTPLYPGACQPQPQEDCCAEGTECCSGACLVPGTPTFAACDLSVSCCGPDAPGQSPAGKPDDGCFCPEVFMPVCGKGAHGVISYEPWWPGDDAGDNIHSSLHMQLAHVA